MQGFGFDSQEALNGLIGEQSAKQVFGENT